MADRLERDDALAALRSLATRADVAAFFEVSLRRFDYHLYVRPAPYRVFTIPKRTGGRRTISAPPRLVRIFQRSLAPLLRDAYWRKPSVYGYCNGGGVADNARRHVKSRVVLNVDLRYFFSSISRKRVYGMFRSKPLELEHPAAAMLAHLCTWEQVLPQGAPTSPIISNWICRRLDAQLSRLARRNRCTYTRFADDLTFSRRSSELPRDLVKSRVGNEVELGDALLSIIEANFFEVNTKKVWVRTLAERQEVTGLVVNERLNVRREFRMAIRAALHDWRENGLELADKRFADHYYVARSSEAVRPPLPAHLRGKLEYMRQAVGNGRLVWARLSAEWERLARRDLGRYRHVLVAGGAALSPDVLREAVWVVRGRRAAEHSEELWTGTAFTLEGVGLVTCEHVVNLESNAEDLKHRLGLDPQLSANDLVLEARAMGAEPGQAWQPVVVEKLSAHHDLAIIRVGSPSICALAFDDRPPKQATSITVAGYPSWFEGNELRIMRGAVSEVRTVSAVRWLGTTTVIEGGMSGGPVLDDRGQVVAVASKGADGTPLSHAAVAIHHLADLTEVTEARPS